jgi:hypothetical protein
MSRSITDTTFMFAPRAERRRKNEMTTRPRTERRELAHRTSEGIDVTLFWSAPANRVSVEVFDSHSNETLEFEVEGGAALDAFNHPYAYAATPDAHNVATRAATDQPRVADQ